MDDTVQSDAPDEIQSDPLSTLSVRHGGKGDKNAQMRRYYAKHPTKRNQAMKRWRDKVKEAIRLGQREK